MSDEKPTAPSPRCDCKTRLTPDSRVHVALFRAFRTANLALVAVGLTGAVTAIWNPRLGAATGLGGGLVYVGAYWILVTCSSRMTPGGQAVLTGVESPEPRTVGWSLCGLGGDDDPLVTPQVFSAVRAMRPHDVGAALLLGVFVNKRFFAQQMGSSPAIGTLATALAATLITLVLLSALHDYACKRRHVRVTPGTVEILRPSGFWSDRLRRERSIELDQVEVVPSQYGVTFRSRDDSYTVDLLDVDDPVACRRALAAARHGQRTSIDLPHDELLG